MGMIDADTLDMLRRKAHAAETVETEDLPLLPGESPPPEPIDPAQEWEGILTMLVMAGTVALPYLPTIYTPEAIKALSGAIVPVAQKYGVDLGGVSSPELALLMVVAPLGLAHVMVHKQWRAQQEAERTVENATAPPSEVVPPQPRSHLGENMQDNGGRLMPQGA
ncbi:hypothetical protein CF70_013045 [Cupriavidus sp. SK-3]|uniref:hypothetical protein n=1 Tax=Cupriavidus sp. SK-3 TaxID=1470558 RepID=UPI00044F8E18|nr:hypothetical protein [Cupriavidus sp. SK-3]KDP85617.1 hypothetical protein CF70_013045 [Cupriavidus sp. SK-3]